MCKFTEITSKENAIIKEIKKLQTTARQRKETGMFVLEGLRLCLDAFDNDIRFLKLIVSETFYNKHPEMTEKFALNSLENYKIPDFLFEKIADTVSPQGVIAVAKIEYKGNNEIDKEGKYIALENIQDPSNLGAVSRTAEALGISGIILTENGVDPFSPKALRASMGALLRMKVFSVSDIIAFCKENSLKSYACVLKNYEKSLGSFAFEKGSVSVIGNEANGITPETISFADTRITIPMSGKAESLNAAVAASLVMWEMQK